MIRKKLGGFCYMIDVKKTGYPHIDKPWMQFYDQDLTQQQDPIKQKDWILK